MKSKQNMEKNTKTRTNKDKNGDNASAPSITYKIIAHYRKYATLFYDQYNLPYIAFKKSGRVVMPIDSQAFYNLICSTAFNEFGKNLSDSSVKNIIAALKGSALYGSYAQKYSLEVRHNRDENQILWYDLGDSAVKIDPNGWEIVANPPILFKRFSHQEKQDTPLSEGSLEMLHNFVNIDDPYDWLLFQIFTISCFIPGFPKPLLVLNGAQGSGKSTPLRILKALIDPSKLRSLPIPKSVEELARISDHHSVLFFDNLSKMPTDVSDNLCKLSTGDGFSKRRLYTDDDDVIYELQRPIMLNGINQIITQADLLDRSIPIELQRIPDHKRKTEDELWTQFYQDRPYILGVTFDVLSKAISIYPSVNLKSLPRMADFAKWGYAIAEAMDGYCGEDFLKAYNQVLKRQNDEALYASPVAQFIIWLMKNKDVWQGTATELYLEFDNHKSIGGHETTNEYAINADLYKLDNSPMWPKDPSSLGRSLNRAAVNLKNIGIKVEKYLDHNQRMIKISNIREEPAEQLKNNFPKEIDSRALAL